MKSSSNSLSLERPRMCLNVLSVCTTFLALLLQAQCLDNGLARTPALGYNTWNAYGGDSEDLSTVLKLCAEAIMIGDMI